MTESNNNNNTETPLVSKEGASQDKAAPVITFSMFVMSLSTSAMMHMGMIKNPLTGTEDKDLPLAKQSIDILDMLKEKTEGNRDEEEEHLMTSVLTDLKMKFVSLES